MNFKFLTGDVNWDIYGGTFVSKKLNNGDFDYWIVEDLNPWIDGDGTYHLYLSVVAPSEAPEKVKSDAARCWGMSDEDLADFIERYGDLAWVEILSSYGIKATLWHSEGTNLRVLRQEARKQADSIEMLFGFWMNRPLNLMGATGWDFIRGDVWGDLTRMEE